MLTLDQIHHWYHRNIDLRNRVIYFGPWQAGEEMLDELKEWEVNDWSISNLMKGLYLLDNSSKKPITIIWCSYGGDYDAGMAAYDFIKHIRSPVHMKCYGRVRSMGTIILQACKKRLVSPNCLFLIHYGEAGCEKKHSLDFINRAKHDEKCNRVMEGIYLKRIKEKHKKYTRDKLKDQMRFDRYMTPHEAVYLGLADRVF